MRPLSGDRMFLLREGNQGMEPAPDFRRLEKVLRNAGEPDRVPFYELFADGQVMETVTRSPVTPESVVEFYYRLGFDYVPTGPNFVYPRVRVPVDDTAALSKGKRYYVMDRPGMVCSREDFDRYQWPALDAGATEPVLRIVAMLPEGMKTIINVTGILENVMWIMGTTQFSLALYDDEQLVWDMFEVVGSNHVKLIEKCMEDAKGDRCGIGAVVMGEDMGYRTATMVSPETLRKYVFPLQRALVRRVHEYGLPFILHTCGQVDAIMNDLIDDVGIDAKHSFEDAIMPVTEAKKKYGKRIALLGGMDVDFLCRADEAAVRAHVDAVLAECAPGGGYALGTGNSVANYIPIRNFLAMLDEGRKMGAYSMRA